VSIRHPAGARERKIRCKRPGYAAIHGNSRLSCLHRDHPRTKGLTFTYAVRRKRGGEWEECEPSRFLFELPAEDVRWTGEDIALDPGQPRERGQAHIAHLRGLLSS
jgi:hypothetical protein